MNDATSNQPIKKVLIICSKGDIISVYPPLVLANGALAEGIKADLFFTFFGLDVITESKMDKLQVATVGNPGMHIPTVVGAMPGMAAMATAMMKQKMAKLDIPPVREFLTMIAQGGGNIYACKLAMDMFGIKKSDLWKGTVDVLTVGEFYGRSEEGSQIIFT